MRLAASSMHKRYLKKAINVERSKLDCLLKQEKGITLTEEILESSQQIDDLILMYLKIIKLNDGKDEK